MLEEYLALLDTYHATRDAMAICETVFIAETDAVPLDQSTSTYTDAISVVVADYIVCIVEATVELNGLPFLYAMILDYARPVIETFLRLLS